MASRPGNECVYVERFPHMHDVCTRAASISDVFTVLALIAFVFASGFFTTHIDFFPKSRYATALPLPLLPLPVSCRVAADRAIWKLQRVDQ